MQPLELGGDPALLAVSAEGHPGSSLLSLPFTFTGPVPKTPPRTQHRGSSDLTVST